MYMKRIKTYSAYRYFPLVLAFLLTGSVVLPQVTESDEETKAAMEEEMKIRKDMLEDEQQIMKEKQIHFMQQHRQQQEMERQHAGQAREIEIRARESARSSRSARSKESARISVRYPDGVYVTTYDDGNHSQLTLRNSFRGGSDTSKGEFDVESDVRHIRCMISGKVSSGEIYILIEYPGGKVFKELTINSSAEISYSQSLSIKEGQENKYVGSWKYEVKAEKAEGSYMLQIQTN